MKNLEKIKIERKEFRIANKERISIKRKEHRLANRERLNAQRMAFYYRNKDKVKAQKQRYSAANAAAISVKNKEWRNKNREELRQKQLEKRRNDPIVRLRHNLRNRLRSAVRGNYKSGSAVQDLGCSIEEFKAHIEKQFVEGMHWGNYGIGDGKWVLDHIIPLAAFDLPQREQFLKAMHYTNYQPLWWRHNLMKADKVNGVRCKAAIDCAVA